MRFVAFSVFLLTCSMVKANSNVYWANVTENALFLLKSEPAGLLDGAVELYACKMWADNRWIIGSFFFVEHYNISDCTVVTYGKAYKTKEFKVLAYPPGSVSWVPSIGKYLDNYVEGGSHRQPSEGPGYVCRAKWKNSLLVGMSHANGTTCYMPKGEREFYIVGASNIEILAENSYGKLFDENFPQW